MPEVFRLDRYDAEFSARTTPAEWARILALRDHPRFLLGLARYDALFPDYFADNVLLNKVVTEAWRFELLVYTLHLYDTRDPADPRTGLTLSRLQDLAARQKIASPGRVAAVLGLMRVAGYLRRQRSEEDARIVHLAPTPKFIGIVEGWNRLILEVIDAIAPEGGLAQSHAAEPRFGWDMRQNAAEIALGGWRLLDMFPEVLHFVSRDGGWMLLLRSVAETIRQSSDNEILPISIDLREFGKRFAASRSQLRRLLETGFEAGLLDAPPRNGAHILLSPKLIASFLACMASELGVYRLGALAALQKGRAPE